MKRIERQELQARVSRYQRLNEVCYYMVTFDLKNSEQRRNIYYHFTNYLGELVGYENSHRLIKQCYFIESNFKPSDIKRELQRLLGPDDSILIVRVRSEHAFTLRMGGSTGSIARKYFGSVKESEELVKEA